MKISFAFVSIFCSTPVNAHLRGDRNLQTFPAYSQQCRDDAGPPFLDDDETFGTGRKYHFGSPAQPVLKDGECADPIKNACDMRNDPKMAYLEGPISCGGEGWYCRILEDENWPPVNLLGDVNFGYCNTTEGFNDAGYDRAGHCHGSDSDETYYWWVRDHWHRGYNGRLKCCCNWESLMEGRIANRCDFRRLVTSSENVNNCRDANEDHGMSFNGGCDQSLGNQIGSPLQEDEGQCWEVTQFGSPGDNNDNGGGGDSEEEDDDDDSADDQCVDDAEFRFKNKAKKNCAWVGKKRRKRCKKRWDGARLSEICPQACRACN